jgi:hypothetical protein
VRLSEQYKVSPKTIRRDAQAAEVISAIGKASPDAKRDILSGKTRISRKMLRDLAAGPEADVVEVAARIQDGTFISGRAVAPEPNEWGAPGGAAPVGTHPLEVSVGGMMEGFFSELRRVPGGGGEAETKAALRSLIGRLEDLYGRM